MQQGLQERNFEVSVWLHQATVQGFKANNDLLRRACADSQNGVEGRWQLKIYT